MTNLVTLEDIEAALAGRAARNEVEELTEVAMACDGDTVATIYRLLDEVMSGLSDSKEDFARHTNLCAVRHFHLPGLLAAYEVDTRRAH